MKDLKINNYKCLNDITISELKRVNLFTGKNNTGKSTILEALSLFAVRGNISWVRQLLESRVELNNYRDETVSVESNISIVSSFFNSRKLALVITTA
jgi:AAA15 family ATPase/GTPase